MDDIVTRVREECGCRWMAGDEVPCLPCRAADEIERLRKQVTLAHRILGSEVMIWLFHGSEDWTHSNLKLLRDPVHSYWEKYGNDFRGDFNG